MELYIDTGDRLTDDLLRAAMPLWESALSHLAGDGTVLAAGEDTVEALLGRMPKAVCAEARSDILRSGNLPERRISDLASAQTAFGNRTVCGTAPTGFSPRLGKGRTHSVCRRKEALCHICQPAAVPGRKSGSAGTEKRPAYGQRIPSVLPAVRKPGTGRLKIHTDRRRMAGWSGRKRL